MMKDLQTIVSDVKKVLEAAYGQRLKEAILFGSHARGDATAASDIDILVVLDDEVDPWREIQNTGEAIATLSLNNDTVISCTFISIERYLGEKSPLMLNVRKEGVRV